MNRYDPDHAPNPAQWLALDEQGLTRHEAIHAIASVLAVHIHDLFNAEVDEAHSTAVYNAAVKRLTAKEWLES